MQSNFLFTNFRYDPGVYYFFYIGELKSRGLAGFLQNMFSRIQDRPVECVAIVPDLHDQYYYANLIVPSLDQIQIDNTHELPVSLRRDPGSFLQAVSENTSIHSLIDRILSHQDQLYIYMYESDPNMSLDLREGVILLGPDKKLARKFNNKAVQFQLLDNIIPLVDYQICETLPELLAKTEELRTSWQDGIFVSRVYSAAGSGSVITWNQADILQVFTENDAPFLITRYMPHDYDPTVLAVVANEQDVYIAGVADQCIEGGNRFVGSTWPSVLPRKTVEELGDCTRKVGQLLGRHGYRGIFGCDYIITRDNQVRFIEINARKQGTTLEFCYTLEQMLPSGSASLPELEYYAVLENRFPDNMVEPPAVPDPPLCWGTYNYKLRQSRQTRGYIPQAVHEQESFSRVARGRLCKDYLVLEHVGSGLQVQPGTFLSRVVSIGKNHQDVDEGLNLGRKLIEMTIETRPVLTQSENNHQVNFTLNQMAAGLAGEQEND